MSQSWSDIKHTLINFLRTPQQMGSIIPSSSFLARRMLDCLDSASTHCIVELGAGTGAITQEVIRRADSRTRILIIDLNADAVRLLQAKLRSQQNIEVIQADARHLKVLLSERGISKVDAIVSSLPYATLGTEVTEAILTLAAEVLAPEGHFVAFQYTSLLKKTIERFFKIRSVRIEFRNLPPAIVYDCVSKKDPALGSEELRSA